MVSKHCAFKCDLYRRYTGGFSKLDLFAAGLSGDEGGVGGATGDAADARVNILSKAARAHMKLKKQKERQFQSVVDEAQRDHKAMLRRQMWDAEDDGNGGGGIDSRLTPARHAAPPSAILSPSPGPRGGESRVGVVSGVSQSLSRRGSMERSQSRRGSVDRSQSQRGSMERSQSRRGSMDRVGGNNNNNNNNDDGGGITNYSYGGGTENDDPSASVGSPSMHEIWAALQQCPSSAMKKDPGIHGRAGGGSDPLLRPTPEKRGSALAPLAVTPEPPNSQQQQQPRRWQNAPRSRLSFAKSSSNSQSEGGGTHQSELTAHPAESLKSPEQGVGGIGTGHLRAAAVGRCKLNPVDP